MLDHFTSEEQKEKCIHALELSIDMWSRMTPTQYCKNDILDHMWMDGTLDKKDRPLNECFLCQFVDEETRNRIYALIEQDAVQGKAYADSMAYYASGMDCARFCPVCWNKKDNPENREDRQETVCQLDGSPYDAYRHMIPVNRKMDKKKILEDMVSLLKESLDDVRKMPVRPDMEEEKAWPA